MSAFEMEESLNEVAVAENDGIKLDNTLARLIREGNKVVDSLSTTARRPAWGSGHWRASDDSKETRLGLRTLAGQMASLVWSVEELTGQAIASANRDKHHRQVLERIETRLAVLEKSPRPPLATSPSSEDTAMRGTSPAPRRGQRPRPRPHRPCRRPHCRALQPPGRRLPPKRYPGRGRSSDERPRVPRRRPHHHHPTQLPRR